MDNCKVVVYSGKISSAQAILPLLEQAARAKQRLLIIAENVDGEALATLIVNRMRGMEIAAVKAPGFGDNRVNMLQDIATLLGTTVINEEEGTKLEDAVLEELGSAARIEISQNSTLILEGAGSKESVEERCRLIQAKMAETTSSYEKEKLSERLAKLSGGVAVIKVGGASEVEVSEVKDRITDALNATRCAVEEGIVPGGGTALLYASEDLDQVETQNFDQKQGVDIVRQALKIPCKTIAANAGQEGAVIVGKLLEQNDKALGFNAYSGT